MRLTRRAGAALGVVAMRGLRLARLPVLEAVPAELVGGADLIGEAKGIHPSLLLRSPTTVPRELDNSGMTTALDGYAADEIRAARPGVDAYALDHPLGVSVQQLIDEPDDLDARNSAHQRDRWRIETGCERMYVGLEAIRGAGPLQDFDVDWHWWNISVGQRVPRASASSSKTKLTAESARWYCQA